MRRRVVGRSAIQGEVDNRRRPRELLCPIVEVLPHLVRSQPLLLPCREVAVLDWQGREFRLITLNQSLIGRPELALNDPARPSVRKDVVNCGDQKMALVRDAKQTRTEQRSLRKIERGTSFFVNEFLKLGFSSGFR